MPGTGTRRNPDDGGFDFDMDWGTVDVKTREPGKDMLIDCSKVRADYYVLAVYHEARDAAQLVGWAAREQVERAEQGRTKHGDVYRLPVAQLNPIDILLTAIHEPHQSDRRKQMHSRALDETLTLITYPKPRGSLSLGEVVYYKHTWEALQQKPEAERVNYHRKLQAIQALELELV